MKQIANLKVKNRIFLAPLDEVGDIGFRLLCKKSGAGLNYCPMIHPMTKQKLFLQDKPVLQIFCKDVKGLKELMKKYESKVVGFDFNLGCPVTSAKKHGFGVFLHSDLKSIEKILKVMRQSTKKFLTVKLRKSDYTKKIISIANKYCDAIIIHPRTQEQGYSGEPDVKFVEQLRRITNLPIIYSGGIDEKNYQKFLNKFDYLMVGRRAIGDPNIFSELTGSKNLKVSFRDYLKLAEKYKLPFRQIKFQAMNFSKRKRNAKKLRLEIFKIKSLEELKKRGIILLEAD